MVAWGIPIIAAAAMAIDSKIFRMLHPFVEEKTTVAPPDSSVASNLGSRTICESEWECLFPSFAG
jgi:hypothetical protein